MFMAQKLMQKISNNELVVGAHTFFTDPAITEMLGNIGFEFVWIDGEHSAFDKEKILYNIMAASSANTASFVRVPWNDPVLIKPILEMGPDGIIIPMITTAEEANQAIAACSYPPVGIRGFGPRRANRYGTISTDKYLRDVDHSFLKIIQVEHVVAVKNLEQIMAVPGIDIIIVGSNDLSGSAGYLGQTCHPKMIALYDEIAQKCKNAKVPFGVSLGAEDKDSIKEWIERGVSIIGCGDDLSFILHAGKEMFNYVHNLKI